MSAEPVPPHTTRGDFPFRDATPAQIRAALVPEEIPAFDRDWRRSMATATEGLDLTAVCDTLDSWRRHAILATVDGHDAYRELMARAERTLRTGETRPGAVTWTELKADLGL